ncbi:MAG TPA: glycosyltransferase family 2 protein [Terriglobales bacterium]|nr:glycosyltransferase family 2 protein [Terriglobales bacterium]
MQLSVIYPAYNEELNIRRTVERSLAALREIFTEFELLIIDDGSRDATGAIADELAAVHPEIRVIHQPRNLGGGAALVCGLGQARGELITHNGMDYCFDLRDLRLMLPLLEEADIVVATRTSRPGYSAYRKLNSVVNVWLLNRLFGLNLRDYNFVQIYKRAVVDAIRVEGRSASFVTAELMIRARDLGFRLRQIDIEYHAREFGVATSGNPRVVARSVWETIHFWLTYRQPQGAADRSLVDRQI